MLPRPGSQELICDLDWNWGQIKISGIRSSELVYIALNHIFNQLYDLL